MAGRRPGTLDRTQANPEGGRGHEDPGDQKGPGVSERMDFEDPAARGPEGRLRDGDLRHSK
jgi:hypothetical protein